MKKNFLSYIIKATILKIKKNSITNILKSKKSLIVLKHYNFTNRKLVFWN
jgi:hypothetical protein